MTKKVSTKVSNGSTQMALIDVDDASVSTTKVKPAKAPKASKSGAKAAEVSAAQGSAKTKAAKPSKPKVEQESKPERPLFKPGQRIFYLREPVVKTIAELEEELKAETETKKVRVKGTPFGCVAYEFKKVTDTKYSFTCGLSLVNHNFDDWNKAKARNIAIGRCQLNPTISVDFSESEAKAMLKNLQAKYVPTSNFEVLFALEELMDFHDMKKVVRAIKATLKDYSLDNQHAP
jgi:hypothetical protein